MTRTRSDESDPEKSPGAASWARAQNVATAEAGVDGDFPQLETRQIYVTASVFLSVWLAMALFFAEFPQKLRHFALPIVAYVDGML